ncbi:MAG: hypothetical protein K2X43_14200 [Hyphomonadaceae bacterium]|jgi:hypothetical protein|nr:hypothetical protein [Hyphomonadaceae bacterium]
MVHLAEDEADLTRLSDDELFARHRAASRCFELPRDEQPAAVALYSATSAEIARRLRGMSDAELEAAERQRYQDWNTGGGLETEKITRARRRRQEIAQSIAASTRARYRAMSTAQLEAEYDALKIRAATLKPGTAQHDLFGRMEICAEELASKRDEIKAQPPDFLPKVVWYWRTFFKAPWLAVLCLFVSLGIALTALMWAIAKLP